MNLQQKVVITFAEIDGDFLLIGSGSTAHVLGKNLLPVEENLDAVIAAKAQGKLAGIIHGDDFVKIVRGVGAGEHAGVELTVLPLGLVLPDDVRVTVPELLLGIEGIQSFRTHFLGKANVAEGTGMVKVPNQERP